MCATSQDVEEGLRSGIADLGRPGGLTEEKELPPVVPSPGFDLETYISNYTGRTRAYRLKHIAQHCPTLQQDALRWLRFSCPPPTHSTETARVASRAGSAMYSGHIHHSTLPPQSHLHVC
jgi:hypothetical protein